MLRSEKDAECEQFLGDKLEENRNTKTEEADFGNEGRFTGILDLRNGTTTIRQSNAQSVNPVHSVLNDCSTPARSYRTLIMYATCIDKSSLTQFSATNGKIVKPLNKLPMVFLMLIIGANQGFNLTFFKFIGEMLKSTEQMKGSWLLFVVLLIVAVVQSISTVVLLNYAMRDYD